MMVGLDVWVIVANLVLATVALVVNTASAMTSPKDWRPLRATVAALAFIYALGYVTLLFGWVSVEVWSRWFRGLSPVVWLIVWSGPPLLASRMWADFERLVREHTQGDDDK